MKKNQFNPDVVVFIPGKLGKLAYAVGVYTLVKGAYKFAYQVLENYRKKKEEKNV